MKQHRPKIAVFASGGGSTFRATADAVGQGLVHFEIGLVITNKEDAGVLEHVGQVNKLYGLNIKTEIINKKRYPDGPQPRGQTLAETEATCKALRDYKIDHLSLMGCMRIVGQQIIDEYGWRQEYAEKDPGNQGIYFSRMSNTHPGILPATADTYGIHTQEKALELNLRETAHTFQVVTRGVDEGPIIAEHRVAVFAPAHYPPEFADTPEKLFARVQRIEKAHLPLDLDKFLKTQALFQAENKS